MVGVSGTPQKKWSPQLAFDASLSIRIFVLKRQEMHSHLFCILVLLQFLTFSTPSLTVAFSLSPLFFFRISLFQFSFLSLSLSSSSSSLLLLSSLIFTVANNVITFTPQTL